MERIEALAAEVIQIARGQALVNLRFLDRAIYKMQPKPNAILPLATDGAHMYYMPWALLKAYRADHDYALRATMHTLLHCVCSGIWPCLSGLIRTCGIWPATWRWRACCGS